MVTFPLHPIAPENGSLNPENIKIRLVMYGGGCSRNIDSDCCVPSASYDLDGVSSTFHKLILVSVLRFAPQASQIFSHRLSHFNNIC